MQSWTTRRELRVNTNILAFRQTLRDRKFSYLCYFEPKGYIWLGIFLEAVNFSPKIFGLSLGIFRKFWDYFWTVWAKFRDCFRTIQVKISGFYSDSPDIIFKYVFGCF